MPLSAVKATEIKACTALPRKKADLKIVLNQQVTIAIGFVAAIRLWTMFFAVQHNFCE